MDGALFLCKVAGEFYEVKLAGKNCMEAFFPAFQGSAFRLHCLTATAAPPFQSGVGCMASSLLRLYGKLFPKFYPKLESWSSLR